MYADYKARGISILPEEFNSAPIPDEENAAFYWQRAANAMDWRISSPASSNMEFASHFLPYPPQWFKMMDKALAANRTVLADIEKAGRLRKVDWKIRFTTPAMKGVLAAMNIHTSSRSVANFMADMALNFHFRGDDAQAMEYVANIRAQARALQQSPMFVSSLVAIGIDGLAMDRLQIMAGNLSVAGTKSAAPKSATLQQVKEMIADLLDDQLIRENQLRSLQCERMIAMDSTLWTTRQSFFLRPMYVLDAHRAGRIYDQIASACGHDNWPTVEALLPHEPPIQLFTIGRGLAITGPIIDDVSRMYSNIAGMGGHRTVNICFRGTFDRRIAAIALATRLYQLDTGHYPAKLMDLVPKYLPAVPIDPFSADHAPIGYMLAYNGTRPVVYGVGEDGLSDTAGEQSIPTFTCWSWQTEVVLNKPNKGGRMDKYRDLSQWMPATRPSPTIGGD
jgi:hypothetical protein